MTTHIKLVYMTTPDREVAENLARVAVGERLAACANIMGAISSVFWWDGRLNEEDEISVILKTTDEKTDALIRRLVELHPYECPCVVAVPVESGHAPFLRWVGDEAGG